MAAAATKCVDVWRWDNEAPFVFNVETLKIIAAGKLIIHQDDVPKLLPIIKRAEAMLVADGVELAPFIVMDGDQEAAAHIQHACACFLDSPFAAPICAFLNARGDEDEGRATAVQHANEEFARAESAAAAEYRRVRYEAEASFCARYPSGDALASATVGSHFDLDPNDAERIARRVHASGDNALLPFLALLAAWPSLNDAFNRFVRPAVWTSEQESLRALIGAAITGYRALPSSITAPAWRLVREMPSPTHSDSPRWPLWSKNLRTVFSCLSATDLNAALAVSIGFEREACANELWITILRSYSDYGADLEAHVSNGLPHHRWDLAPYRYWRKQWVDFRLSRRLVATCVNFGTTRTTKRSSGSSGMFSPHSSDEDDDGDDDDDDDDDDAGDDDDGRVVILGGRDRNARLAIKNGFLTEQGTVKRKATQSGSAVSSVLRYGFSREHAQLARNYARSPNAEIDSRIKTVDVSSRDRAVNSSLITLHPWHESGESTWKNTSFGSQNVPSSVEQKVDSKPPSWRVELPPGEYRVWAAIGDRGKTSSAEISVAPGLFAEKQVVADDEEDEDDDHRDDDTSNTSPLSKGRRVRVDWRGGEKYEGNILDIEEPLNPRSTFTVQYDDGDVCTYSQYTVSATGAATVIPKATEGTTGIVLLGPPPDRTKKRGPASRPAHKTNDDIAMDGERVPDAALRKLRSARKAVTDAQVVAVTTIREGALNIFSALDAPPSAAVEKMVLRICRMLHGTHIRSGATWSDACAFFAATGPLCRAVALLDPTNCDVGINHRKDVTGTRGAARGEDDATSPGNWTWSMEQRGWGIAIAEEGMQMNLTRADANPKSTSSSTTAGVRGTDGWMTGRHTWTVSFQKSGPGTHGCVGICTAARGTLWAGSYTDVIGGADRQSWGWHKDGKAMFGGVKVGTLPSYSTNDKLTVTLDLTGDSGILSFSKKWKSLQRIQFRRRSYRCSIISSRLYTNVKRTNSAALS
jgi:hypothetical protein